MRRSETLDLETKRKGASSFKFKEIELNREETSSEDKSDHGFPTTRVSPWSDPATNVGKAWDVFLD